MTIARTRRPVVGIVCDVRQAGLHPFHMVGEKYVAAAAYGAQALPVIMPPAQAGVDSPDEHPFYDVAEMLELLDGLLIPGSPSNLDPAHYGQERQEHHAARDPQRDGTSLALIEGALDAGLPLLALCRGFQEMNVVLGGSLHQQVHQVDGYLDHRSNHDDPRDMQYAPVHDVVFSANGQLRALTGVDRLKVNSLHEQGIDRLAGRLVPEAMAPDGLIEAARVAGARGFALGVQWHPEWRFWQEPASMALFTAFGDAARSYAAHRT